MKWAKLKYPLIAGTTLAIVFDYTHHLYDPITEDHWNDYKKIIKKSSPTYLLNRSHVKSDPR